MDKRWSLFCLNYWRWQAAAFTPFMSWARPPIPKLQRPDPKPHGIPGVQRAKLGQRQLHKMRVVGRRNGSWHPACHRLLRGRIPLPHDGCNHLRQRLSMPQPKNVWWHQVLLHRHVLLTRPLVGPHKHIAQQVPRG